MSEGLLVAVYTVPLGLACLSLILRMYVEHSVNPWRARQAASRLQLCGMLILLFRVVVRPDLVTPWDAFAVASLAAGIALATIARVAHYVETPERIEPKRTQVPPKPAPPPSS